MICMNQIMVDVTEIPGVEQGDSAVLIGCDEREKISVYELAV